MYESENPFEHEEDQFCHFGFEGCTVEATHTWESPLMGQGVGGYYPCCENCYNKRAEEQERINEKYLDITPFSGPNEYGEYYDEDSY